MTKKSNLKSAQTFLEYTILIGIVITVLVAMSPVVKRATQGMYKLVADQVGNQVNAEQTGERGYMRDQYTFSRIDQIKRRRDFMGTTEYRFDGSYTDTTMLQSSDLGVHPDPRK